jgi:hypothetical protein
MRNSPYVAAIWHVITYFQVESYGAYINRFQLVFLLAACPAAHTQQDDYVEGRKQAAAFTQVDLDALGRCHARVEGAGLILQDMESWLVAENQTGVLDALRNKIELGADVLLRLSEARDLTA